MDFLFLPFFSLTDNPLKSYLIGIFFLALASKLVGEISIDFIFRKNRDRIAKLKGEADRLGELSMLALSVDDIPAYEACNKKANENFSKLFYLSITMSAAYLWPVFFSLQWLQYHFMEKVEYSIPFSLPFFGNRTFGYAGAFILAYILVYIIFKIIKPYFWKIAVIPEEELNSSILSDEDFKDMINRLKEKK